MYKPATTQSVYPEQLWTAQPSDSIAAVPEKVLLVHVPSFCAPYLLVRTVLATAGLPDAKRAAAESLTNLAACTTLQTTTAAERGMPASSGSPSRPPQAADTPSRGSFNPKIEVQRAGAISPLLAMLRCQGDEPLMRAAANTLYVLAEEEENRSIMQSSSVRQVWIQC